MILTRWLGTAALPAGLALFLPNPDSPAAPHDMLQDVRPIGGQGRLAEPPGR